MKSLFFIVVTFTPLAFPAVGSEVLEEGSFVDAVEKEDVALLRKRIQIRLKGPFPEFVDEFFFLTVPGGNIFHALAETKTNQEEFSKTLEELIRIFSIRFNADSKIDTLTLAGMEIHFKTNMEDTPLFQAVRTGKLHKIAGEMENIFEKGPALSALSYLHGRVGPAVLLPGNENHPSLISDLSEMDLSSLKKIVSSSPYLTKDYNGFSPQQIAEQNKNLTAFNVLSVAPDNNEMMKHLPYVTILSIGGFVGFIFPPLTDILGLVPATTYSHLGDVMQAGFLMAVIGGVTAVVTNAVLPPCYRAFKKKRIAAERMPETSIFKDSRFFSPSGEKNLR